MSAAHGSDAPESVSVVVTVRNEQRHISDLLDSLVVQEGPLEILVVDAASTDKTRSIVRQYAERFPFVRLLERAGTRAESRNYGVKESRSAIVAFIDGDCIANPFWLRELRRQLRHSDVAAGRTIQIGYWAFEALHRVELGHRGYDVTFPSCNLAYKRGLFEKIGGFDGWFHTAEDIDLNYRAVDTGATIGYVEDAIVYHRARDTFGKFFKQAYWNGYGRKQLTLKHGNLWSSYSFKRMFRQQLNFWGVLRLASASLGYIAGLLKEGSYPGRAA
ncbi:MAG TPA: glycosyltransferase [Candidatus Thermoplasmatota archaeon]|nr:glycosyltransferase [Candidatus Thermoplasmatota archaeon]